ncbi:hypothetical protein IE4872_PD01730 (plasmid) [Rhizobium gallicum]|uniref:Uncharacterized protein n=1 Tax=Rhizobium gallicum TaxID=56730 RepID=A0A1L5NWL4_9HYPH|nr:hypothetical protein IE4872_PD01730 [Rhizobium gallicum]
MFDTVGGDIAALPKPPAMQAELWLLLQVPRLARCAKFLKCLAYATASILSTSRFCLSAQRDRTGNSI